jgi:cell division protein FtsB
MNVLSRRPWGWIQVWQAQVRRRFLRALIVIGILWAGYGIIAGEAGLIRIWSLKEEARDLERNIAALKQETEEIRRQHELLETDPEFLEKVARENYGLAREDEIVFRFEREEGAEGE